MAKKRKKLDEFLHARKQSHEAELEETARRSRRLFRFCASVVVVLALLLFLEIGDPDPWSLRSWIGVGVLFGMLTVLGTYTVSRLETKLFRGAAGFGKFVLLILTTVVVYKYLLTPTSEYLSPLPVLGMVLGIAYSRVAGVLVVLGLSFYLAFLLPPDTPLSDSPLEVAVVLIIGAVVSVLGMSRLRKQTRPVIVGFYCGVLHAAAIVCFQVLREPFPLADFRPSTLAEFLGSDVLSDFLRDPGYGFLSGIISGGIITSVLPAIEVFFGVVTERRLLDLADPSNKLLRVLRERAPGTFQHTLGVQQLSRTAAEAIGADVLLTEVGAYYHDIGKMIKPEYFVENMGEDKSIHDRLRPSMSKMIIISHVKDGILLAKEEKLPQKIVDMIPMHHGTTVVEFFFRKARKASAEEEETPLGDVEYRYPGPKPRFAEAGVLLLADAVEAIAKAMADPSSNRFRDMVRDVIMGRLQDGQLDECNLTIADLRKIEDSFVRTLTNMYHSRIDYNTADDSVSQDGGAGAGAAKSERAKVREPARGVK